MAFQNSPSFDNEILQEDEPLCLPQIRQHGRMHGLPQGKVGLFGVGEQMGFRDAAQEPHLPAGNGAFCLQHVKRLRIIPVIGAVLDLLHAADVLHLQPPGEEHAIQHEPRHRQHQHNQQPRDLVVRAVV